MILIKNGTIFTMENEIFENGYLLINNKTIKEVGNFDNFDKSKYEIEREIDAKGRYVFPGFVDAHCHVGMWEDSMGFEGDDGNEDTDPITPQLRAIDAINPLDKSFTEAYMSGITTVVTGPGSANVIGGQFAALKTYGKRIDDMVIKSPLAMKVAFGENPKSAHNDKNQSPITRMATAALLREVMFKTQRYIEEWQNYSDNPEEYDKPDYDFKLEALIPVIKGELPIKVHAHRTDDIFTAIRIAKEFNLKITIEHCTEGHLITEELKNENIPLMVGPSLTDRSKIELKELSFETPGILSRASMNVAIITDHPATPIQYLPVCAALAVKNGMDKYEALKSITINAAKNCFIDDKVGSIKAGKDADIVIFDREPLDYMSNVLCVIINGKTIYEK